MYFYINETNKTFFKSKLILNNRLKKVQIKSCNQVTAYSRKLHKEGYVIKREGV